MSEVYEPPMSDLETAIAQAYEQGIKAARDAVAAVACGPQGSSNRFWRDTALAAIDGVTP